MGALVQSLQKRAGRRCIGEAIVRLGFSGRRVTPGCCRYGGVLPSLFQGITGPLRPFLPASATRVITAMPSLIRDMSFRWKLTIPLLILAALLALSGRKRATFV